MCSWVLSRKNKPYKSIKKEMNTRYDVYYVLGLEKDYPIKRTKATEKIFGSEAFEKDGDYIVKMSFRDGYAVDVEGKGIELTYPSISKVRMSLSMMRAIANSSGKDDFNQYDIAVKYGKVSIKGEKSENNKMTFSVSEAKMAVVVMSVIYHIDINIDEIDFSVISRLTKMFNKTEDDNETPLQERMTEFIKEQLDIKE
jgi:hypothetical protein